MTRELDPLVFTRDLEERYRDYLATAFRLRDAGLQAQLRELLEQRDKLVKGPYLEVTPPFRTGKVLDELVGAGVLHRDVTKAGGIRAGQPLYKHQQRAIESVVRDGRNIVVATGTGSGKTECFLYPILDHLLRERDSGTLARPGVRALLMYPMNALARDQVRRLRKFLAPFPQITFGRYIGETLKTEGAAESDWQRNEKEDRLPNELLSRERMQREPPHILLTNYSMLEYLLLRPEDHPLFASSDGQTWRFLVLDEAHTYDGALGMEIGMLLRKLKERVCRSSIGRLRCIATSATLSREGQTEGAREVVRFAHQLFAEAFAPTDVIHAERKAESELSVDTWGRGSPELYRGLRGLAPPPDASDFVAPRELPGWTRAIPSAPEGLDAAESYRNWLWQILRGDGRLADVRRLLAADRCVLLDDLLSSDGVLGDVASAEERADTLLKLVHLANSARRDADDSGLLPARYHLFVAALQGAYVYCESGDPREWRITLKRHKSLETKFGARAVFELARCVRCGQHYLAGQEVPEAGQTYLRPGSVGYDGDSGNPIAYFALARAAAEDVDSDQPETSDDTKIDGSPYQLCVACGALFKGQAGLQCGCVDTSQQRLVEVYLLNKDKPAGADELAGLRVCPTCGQRSNAGLIKRLQTGRDAPVGVLTMGIYHNLPESPDPDQSALPGGGRKVLIFADSRQDAAFFAPYCQRHYDFLLRRRVIYKRLEKTRDDADFPGYLALPSLCKKLVEDDRSGEFLRADSAEERRTRAWNWVMQEFIGADPTRSLEGVGLACFVPRRPPDWSTPEVLSDAPWSLSADQAWSLVVALLNTMRLTNKAVSPGYADFEDADFKDLFPGAWMTLAPLGSEKDKVDGREVRYWLGTRRGRNSRVDLLLRALADRGVSGTQAVDAARAALTGIWGSLHDARAIFDDKKTRHATFYRLKPDAWELRLVDSENLGRSSSTALRCDRCGRVSYGTLDDLCPYFRCDGCVRPMQPGRLQDDYFRKRFTQPWSVHPIRAMEHTAQLTTDEARVRQDSFQRGETNVLSCSTTFELGVDLGELQTVLMRNVPPETSNYVQRVGRAGRRTDSAAIAVTYCQRRSHDMAYYAEPRKLISGDVRPPIAEIRNDPVVRRHLWSVLSL